jgi:hypothetical protein
MAQLSLLRDALVPICIIDPQEDELSYLPHREITIALDLVPLHILGELRRYTTVRASERRR